MRVKRYPSLVTIDKRRRHSDVMYEDQTKPRKPSQRQQIQLSLLWNSLTEPYTDRVIDLINRMLFKIL